MGIGLTYSLLLYLNGSVLHLFSVCLIRYKETFINDVRGLLMALCCVCVPFGLI